MGASLEEKLRFLTGSGEYDATPPEDPDEISFDPPVLSDIDDDEPLPESLSIETYLRYDDKGKKGSGKGKKKKRSELFDGFEPEEETVPRPLKGIRSEKLYNRITKRMTEEMVESFDSFLDDPENFSSEDSEELSAGLVSMGRKYARETGLVGETSEIAKTFSESEKKLKALYDELTRDTVAIQRDLDRMRGMTRGINYKALSDMVAAKNSSHSTQLGVIKEINATKKTKFELALKDRAAREASSVGGDDISANTLKNLFSAGRANIVGATGGYAEVSGSSHHFELDPAYEVPDDDGEPLTDGDRYLATEGRDVKLHLLVDDDMNPVDIVAKDRDGVIVPDYPMPTADITELKFNINRGTGEAQDELHRNYVVEQI
ncbi:MAG: hypothetical protein NC548_05990 [Lachnospiraceae bacterium]|nr:hypothetical protein [Lachnospiraceae bacterium]